MQTAHESVQSAPPHGLCTLFVWRIRSLPVQACHGGHVELLHGKGWKRPTWRARPRLLTITGVYHTSQFWVFGLCHIGAVCSVLRLVFLG